MGEGDDSADEPQDDINGGPRGGERLAEARREQQITVLEVAKELHLDEHKVRALENNDFDVLGAPVFAKGHLRKYAQLVGVDEADVFADYYAMTRSTPMPPIVTGRRKLAREMSPGPWIAIIIVLAVAAAAYWWFTVRVVAPASPVPVEEPAAEEIARPAPPLEERPQQSEAIVEPEVTDEDVEPAASAASPALTDDEVRLSVSFSGECWTEISDADGRRLFFNMGRAGQTVELSGKAPLSALFGNADNVRVRLNDNDYPLPAPADATRTISVSILKP